MNKYFKQGFCKTASHILAEIGYDGDSSEHKQQRQAILEASYEDDNDQPLNKDQKKTKKLVKEDAPYQSNPGNMYLMERA